MNILIEFLGRFCIVLSFLVKCFILFQSLLSMCKFLSIHTPTSFNRRFVVCFGMSKFLLGNIQMILYLML